MHNFYFKVRKTMRPLVEENVQFDQLREAIADRRYAAPYTQHQIDYLTGILINPKNGRNSSVELVQQQFYREQVNGVIYYRRRVPCAEPSCGIKYEIYLTNLHGKVDAWALLNIFEILAPVKLFRFMVTYSGDCRGFAFLEYYNAAAEHIGLHNIPRMCYNAGIKGVVARKSIDKRVLMIQRSDLEFSEFVQVVNSVLNCEGNMINENEIELINGCYLIRFQSNRDASIAKRQILLHINAFSKTTNIKVTWKF